MALRATLGVEQLAGDPPPDVLPVLARTDEMSTQKSPPTPDIHTLLPTTRAVDRLSVEEVSAPSPKVKGNPAHFAPVAMIQQSIVRGLL